MKYDIMKENQYIWFSQGYLLWLEKVRRIYEISVSDIFFMFFGAK